VSEIKDKAVSGVFWSAAENFANMGLQFIIGIILARLIAPKEFGLVGMLTIFIAISQTFIDSGFVSALVRKKNVSKEDYSTAFIYNVTTGLILYSILYFSAGAIAKFFDEPQLVNIVRVLGVGIIIGSLTIVQSAVLLRRVDFKLLAKIKIISTVISGTIAIALAFKGFGVWSIVARQILDKFLNSLLLWVWNNFIPVLKFSVASFKDLFGYGSKLLLSGLINTAFENIYLVVIGKYFSATDLGYYTRANTFKDMPSHSITNIISRVTFPLLAQIQEDKNALKAGYKRMIKTTMFLTFSLLIGMASVASPLVLTLLGEIWRPSIVFLQLLCFVGMFFPLHALNLNLLNVLGRSDLFLRLEIIKKIFVIPVVIIGIIWGIKFMIIGMIVNSFIAYYLNSFYSGRMINYSTREQLKDILPSLILALVMGGMVFILGLFLPYGNLVKLIIQTFAGVAFVVFISEVLKMESYLYTKSLIIEKLGFLKK
jgi:teichuronic acid exporter